LWREKKRKGEVSRGGGRGGRSGRETVQKASRPILHGLKIGLDCVALEGGEGGEEGEKRVFRQERRGGGGKRGGVRKNELRFSSMSGFGPSYICKTPKRKKGGKKKGERGERGPARKEGGK